MHTCDVTICNTTYYTYATNEGANSMHTSLHAAVQGMHDPIYPSHGVYLDSLTHHANQIDVAGTLRRLCAQHAHQS